MTAFSEGPRVGPVVLPIEILGPDGHTVSATVDISDPAGVSKLWIQGNAMNFVYSDQTKASVRVNNGAWIPLNDDRVTCDYPDDRYGCIAGPRPTVKFSVPISGIVAGANQVDFRFNGTDGMSIGWRVIDFNFLRNDGSKVLPASAFVRDNPANWQPPSNSSADIAQGKQLWESATLITSLLPDNKVMRAKCADCHDKTGHDLKYFSFSNKSVIARSVFHGLSQSDGEKIASYIRTLPGKAYGTPWDPPYQPGPGLDSKPVEEWAAGAGLEWVLDNDSEMMPYVFPDSDRRAVTDTKSTLNMREIPIAFQLPDWNNWLPRIHPLDAYGDIFANSSGYLEYERDLEAAMSGFPNEKSIRDTNIEYVLSRKRDWGRVRTDPTSRDESDAAFGLRQWRLVKVWELNQKYKIEDQADELYPADARGIEQGEVRGWPGLTPMAWGLAPHRIVANQSSGVGPYRDRASNVYFSTAWYQLQVVINAGYRLASEQNVVDWKYHMPHVREVDEVTGHDQSFRFLTSYMKRLQVSDNVTGANYGKGWQWRINSPAAVWYGEVGNGTNPGALNRQQFKDLIEPILYAWITKTEEFEPDDWCREVTPLCLTPADYIPIPYSGSGYFLKTQTYATQMFRLLPELDKIGVDPAILQRMATWFQRAWPLVDWHSLYSGGANSNSKPTTSLSSPQNNSSFEVGSDIGIAANATDADGSIDRVEFYVDNTRVSTDTAAPYEYNWTATLPGSYSITARAFDNDGDQTTSASRTVSITSAVPQQSTHSIALQQGWNLVSSYVVPDNASMPAVFNLIKSEILLVKNSAGEQYHPPSGLNTIGNWDSAEAYEIYSSSPQTLRITGNEVDPSTSVSMSEGWNHLAYLRKSGLPIEQALATISDKVNIVKDATGKVYYPAFSINEIGSMSPGQGYKVHLSASATLSYPAASGKGAGSVNSGSAGLQNSALLIVEGTELVDGTTVVVKSTSGIIAGEGVVIGGTAVVHLRGDDIFTPNAREGVSERDVLVVSFADPDGAELDDISISGIRDGLANKAINDAVIRYEMDAVFIASVTDIPGETELDQNFPNPFTSDTSIRYSLPNDSHVTLDVYNIAGQHIARIVDSDEPAGWHSVEFDSRGQASGVYLYRLVTDDTVKHKQMLLRK